MVCGVREVLPAGPEELGPRKVFGPACDEIKRTVQSKMRLFGSSGKTEKSNTGSGSFKPVRDLFFPDFNLFMMLGITFFEVFQKPLNQVTSGREDRQTDHQKKDSLQDGKKKADDSQPDEEPTDDQHSDLLDRIHFGSPFSNIDTS